VGYAKINFKGRVGLMKGKPGTPGRYSALAFNAFPTLFVIIIVCYVCLQLNPTAGGRLLNPLNINI